MQFLNSSTISMLIAAVAAFLVTFVTAPPVIAYLRAKKLGQQIRDDGPQRHLAKAGTPTMGGVVILTGVIVGCIAAWSLLPQQWLPGLLVLGLTIAVSAVGSIDDWGKIRRGRSLGLRARDKLLLQFVLAGAFLFAMHYLGIGNTTLTLPGGVVLQLSWWYWPFALLLIAGMSNAVNLTDGLDGLAAGTTAAATIGLAIIAFGTALHSVAVVMIALCAACLAFLWYNRHPAKVFMGDTGSLAIGAALAGAALTMKHELLLLWIGLIFVIEAGSVIIQVISFKTTGKRVFRMSPFHHHLELSGWTEPTIVTRAWMLGGVLATSAVFAYFLLK